MAYNGARHASPPRPAARPRAPPPALMDGRPLDLQPRGAAPRALQYLEAGLQYLYPQRLASRLMYRAARLRWGPLKDRQIHWFSRRYGVDLGEAEQPDPRAYAHFNAFFTRALRAGARPLPADPRAVVCPADGEISAAGEIRGSSLLQAKGREFDLRTLLGGDAQRAAPFTGGHFLTVYLAPRDYHRVHLPLDGRLREMVHVPGRLFSVSPATTRLVPDLFARNERVVTLFETAAGPMAVVLVGAILVAGIETVWAGEVTPRRGRRIRVWRYGGCGEAQVAALRRGEELGRFNMGSTVILLLPQGSVEWLPEIRAGRRVRMGTAVGRLSTPP